MYCTSLGSSDANWDFSFQKGFKTTRGKCKSILGDPGTVSRDDRMFVVKVYCKAFITNILSSRLTVPGSPRMSVSRSVILYHLIRY